MKRFFIPIVLFIDIAHAQPGFPPTQAAKEGFTQLIFNDEFRSINFESNNRIWFTESWLDPSFDGRKFGSYKLLPDGGLRMTINPGNPQMGIGIVNHPPNHIPFGPDYIFGYFEARMRFSGTDVANSWGTFWLESKKYIENTDSDANGNEAWCELDVFEADGHYTSVTTEHSWTKSAGGAQKNSQNINAVQTLSIDPLDGNWHTFGLLWKQDYVAWYIDDMKVADFVSYPICNTHPMTLLVGAQDHIGDSQTTDVSWVRVWQ
jgi:hypothetical protein